MQKTIVITGVTGIQGSSVANTFLTLPGWIVRGITRNPSSAAARTLSEKGVEIVSGDFDDNDTLRSAFLGATVIFSNTDYFTHLWAGEASSDVRKDRTSNQYAYEREVQQGLNIAEAASDSAVLATLQHFVYSSLSEARKWSKGKYLAIYHNDSKAEVISQIQQRLPEIRARMSLLQMGHYVTNWKQAQMLQPLRQDSGVYVFQRPSSPDFIVPFVWAQADTGVLVKFLLGLPIGTTLEGASEYMTWPQWVEIWGKVLGVTAVYKQVSMDDFFAGQNMPKVFEREFRESFAYAEEFTYTGGDPEVKNADKLGITAHTSSIEKYIRQEEWSFVA